MTAQDDGPIPLADNGDLGSDDSFSAMMAEMGTRPHHVFFAHHIFREWVFKNPLLVFAVAVAGKGDDLVKDIWRKVGEQLLKSGTGAKALPCDDLTVEVTPIAGCPTVLIHLPPPKGPPEAYFVAIVMTKRPRRRWLLWHSPPSIRYVTLERGVSLFAEDGVHTVLCEWKQDGSHANYGRGPSPSRTSFVEAVLNLVFRPWKMLEARLGLGAQGHDSTDHKESTGAHPRRVTPP